jgi:hypothetical protein
MLFPVFSGIEYTMSSHGIVTAGSGKMKYAEYLPKKCTNAWINLAWDRHFTDRYTNM